MSKSDIRRVPLTSRERHGILAAVAGHSLESFDLSIYALLAVTLSTQFFPTGNPALSLVLAFGSYGVSFVVRPLGAAFLGSYADRHGRRAALSLALKLMGGASLAMAAMPDFAMIGVAAPLGLLAARLVQGFSAGGENSTAITFLAEHHPDRRGEILSWVYVAGGIATMSAAAVVAADYAIFDAEQMRAWGWRVPFILGTLIYPIAVYVRSKTEETPEFKKSEALKSPLRAALRQDYVSIVRSVFIMATGPVAFYMILFLPTFASTELGLPQYAGLVGSIAGGAGMFAGAPFAGRACDKLGFQPIMIGAALMLGALAWPAFNLLISAPSVATLILIDFSLGVISAAYFVPTYVYGTGAFPAATRTTSVALTYAISQTIFGGFTPAIASTLVAAFQVKAAPSIYLAAVTMISVLALVSLPRKLGEPVAPRPG
jgi:MHS family proline/betaine transporter-like MFS transporter